MYKLEDALYAASMLGVKFDKFTPSEFLDGINVELEHGTISKETNVTNNNLITIIKIMELKHLKNF